MSNIHGESDQDRAARLKQRNDQIKDRLASVLQEHDGRLTLDEASNPDFVKGTDDQLQARFARSAQEHLAEVLARNAVKKGR